MRFAQTNNTSPGDELIVPWQLGNLQDAVEPFVKWVLGL